MTQQQKIFNHLKRKPITGLEAWMNYGVYRLSEIIIRIRQQGKSEGFTVKTEMVNQLGKRFAKYSLLKLKK